MSDMIPAAGAGNGIGAGPGTVELDGRRARRERGRSAVVDAMFALVQEGTNPPAVEDVAARAGVSVSSVFRYFDNVDDLQHHTIERYFERFAPLFAVPSLGEGPLADRITALVEARIKLYEAIAPLARFARARALDHPPLAATLAATRSTLAGQIRAHFAPELAATSSARADDLVALVDSVISFESWDLLSTAHARSRTQIRRAWLLGLQALIR